MKICKKCGEEGKEFWKNKLERDGLQCWCKDCLKEYNGDRFKQYYEKNKSKLNKQQRSRRKALKSSNPERYSEINERHNEWVKDYRHTPKGRAATMWTGMVYRCKHKYKNIEVRFSRGDFIAWATTEIDKFSAQHPDDTPSVDRIDYNGHYEFGNVRITSLRHNVVRSRMITHVLGLRDGDSSEQVFEQLAIAVLGVCNHTGASAEEFARFLLENADGSPGNYKWHDEVL